MRFSARGAVICLLVAATLAAYGQVAGHKFVTIDDDVHVYRNPHVNTGLTWANVKWAFAIHGPSQWHPLAWLSHQLDCTLFGLRSGWHHGVNLLLHLAGTLVLLLVLERMTGNLWPSALVAALFALHPLHVESVAWISERRDVLSGLLFMLTLGAYVAYARRGGLGRYLLVVLGLALGLMAKPMLVTVPLVLLLLDVWPLGRLRLGGWDERSAHRRRAPFPPQPIGRLVAEKLPLLALSVVSGVLTVLCQQKAEAIHSLEAYPPAVRLANAALSYTVYLRKMIWPSDLAVFYPYRTTLDAWRVDAALVFLAAMTALVLYLAKRRPYLAVGWFWYLVTLVPVIGLVQAGDQALADRFTYLPLIGIYMMIAWGAADLLGRRMLRRDARIAVGSFAGVILAALLVSTWFQARHWRTSVALFEHAVDVTTDNPKMHNSLGHALHLARRYDSAVGHYTQAIDLKPDYAEAFNNRGFALYQFGRLEPALADFDQAIELAPGYAKAFYNRAIVYHRLGKLELALSDYTRSIELRPGPGAYFNRGNAARELGQNDLALADYSRAIELNPNHVDALHNRAVLYFGQGQYAPAWADVNRIQKLGGKLHPQFLEALSKASAQPAPVQSGGNTATDPR